jgi:hypothetical protein
MKPITRISVIITTVAFIIAGAFGFVRKFRQ